VTTSDLVGQALTTFEVSSDGEYFKLNFLCQDGRHGSVSLPTECLKELVMTLPRLMTQALQAKHRDESLCVVYPVERTKILKSADSTAIVVTMVTHDQFEVSFAFTTEQFRGLGAFAAAAEQELRDLDSERNQNYN
jgi:hypothetical protein